MKPPLSVLIANANGAPEISACLAALEKQAVQRRVEVIVVEPTDSEMSQKIRRQFAWVQLVLTDRNCSIPQMLVAGLAQCEGEIVAVLEDHEIVLPGWCEAVLDAHRLYPEAVAIAGPIDNGCVDRVIDWATFFCEYCKFMSPIQAGETDFLPGHNVTYKRRGLDAGQHTAMANGFWDHTLHPDLRRRGFQFRMEPVLKVLHKKQIGFFEFVEQRFLYSRYFAGSRTRNWGLLFRIGYALTCFALPMILLGRILACGFAKGSFQKELLRSTPFLLVFTLVWAFGEMAGSLLGRGSSLALIR
ncbi:MAG: glycosyltransferase family 2 protein [Anaerolineales bacterium]|nr:glycosyltransferase family 2 protein [Anaerolineales bacterium]